MLIIKEAGTGKKKRINKLEKDIVLLKKHNEG